MKKYLVITLLFSNVYLFAQMKTVMQQTFQQPINLNVNFNNNKPTFVLNQLQFRTDYDFSIYNRTTQLNDNFSYYNGKLEYKNSIIIPENLIYNNKMDSFNPNGVSDFKGALLTGFLNLTLSLFQSE
ncbi:hypothetical protein [Flavobacterium tibetense]|uniref:Outer membrane protein beta-barrel domain-containing protein n=1 Tax=Flavobacterium tibetense TaxID=2233533 RepID=A0A365P5V0_9FLAO|nr:hypothetical protein [Flavobacterium tibetense]RBA29955.1 hypothetical protein DPN68_01650 [Flavobacterium tibetense]